MARFFPVLEGKITGVGKGKTLKGEQSIRYM